MTLDEAIETMVCQVVSEALQADGAFLWDDHPDIGEYDWDAIATVARRTGKLMAPAPLRYRQAYDLLSDRAGKSEART